MKKTISFLLAILLVSSCFAFRSPDANALGAVWVKEYYTDKFGDKTEQYYLTNKSQFKGTYNTNSVNNGKLGAKLVFEREEGSLFAYIELYLKETEQIKNAESNKKDYDVSIKRTDGTQFSTSGVLFKGESRIEIADTVDLANALAAGNGEVAFYIEEITNTNNNYLFKAKCGNFKEIYDKEILIPYQEEQYQLGEQLLADNEYDRAIAVFQSLVGYKDSTSRVKEVKEAKNADAYDRAERLLKQKSFDKAIEAFKALGDYRDSASRVEDVIEAKNADAYSRAELMLQNKQFDNAIAEFEALGDYSDSVQRVKETTEAKLADAYAQAETLLEQKKFDEAANAFGALGEYRDSASRIEAVNEAKLADAYAQAEALLEQHKFDEAIKAFQKLGDYRDSINRIDEIQLEKKEFIYQEADSLYDAGDYDAAYSKFLLLTGYKDVDERLETDSNLINAAKVAAREAVLKSFKTVGKIVQFGSYEQNNDSSNGKEKIEWIVLDTEDNRSLLLSRYGLDAMQYNTSLTDVSWKTCSLRSWLNGSFLSSAFNSEEKKAILITNVETAFKKNPRAEYESFYTDDRLFLLSSSEVREYLDNDHDKCKPTEYVKALSKSKSVRIKDGYCYWWLRTQGDQYQTLAQAVNQVGCFNDNNIYYEYNAVRPAFWIDLESDYFWSIQ